MPAIAYYTIGYVYFNTQVILLEKLVWKWTIKCQDS